MPRKGENIYKRSDGRWEGRYPCGFRSDGKTKYRSIYGHSYQEVRAKLLPLKAAKPALVKTGKQTFGELFEEWMTAVQLRVKPSTLANYRMKAEKHILPAFSGLRYVCLTADMVHEFIRQKLENGLSSKYVADIVVVIKSMAKYISRVHGFANPLADVVLPKTERQELQLFTVQQQKRLEQYLLHNMGTTSICILLSLYMGLRVGEVCGLKWADIDFDKSILTVRRTVQRVHIGHGTRLIIDSPKSRASKRSIPILDFLVLLLREHRRDGECYLLSGTDRVIEPRTLQHRFHVILQKAGLPSKGYHSLRHQFATNCIRAGFDVKTLAEILGHASVETTLSRYVHSSMERKRECMTMLRPVA